MTIAFMRWVDKWIGVPLCGLLSLLHSLFRVSQFSEGKPSNEPLRKILFIQLSEMGSSIAAYSSLQKAKTLFPGVQLYYLIFEEMQASIRLLDTIPDENILTISSQSFASLLRDTLRVLARARREEFDAVVDLELFSRVSSVLSFLLCRRIRVGFSKFAMEGLYRGNLQTRNVIYNHLNHISLNYLSLVYALIPDVNSPEVRQPLSKCAIDPSDLQVPQRISSPEAKQHIFAKLQHDAPGLDVQSTIILLNPNGSALLPLRRWPMENYSALATRLLQNPSVWVVLTGTASERSDAETICAATQHPHCINFAGKTSFSELIDLYNIAHAMVSNDSGPPHFASLTTMPTFVFFGPETPACYAPLGKNIEVLYASFLCSPCVSAYNHRVSACNDNRCLQAISVDAVLQALERKLPTRIQSPKIR